MIERCDPQLRPGTFVTWDWSSWLHQSRGTTFLECVVVWLPKVRIALWSPRHDEPRRDGSTRLGIRFVTGDLLTYSSELQFVKYHGKTLLQLAAERTEIGYPDEKSYVAGEAILRRMLSGSVKAKEETP